MELGKYMSVLKVIWHYILACLGKLIGYIVTPLVYPHRDWLRNYIWNWMQVNGIKCNRSTIWAEDEFKYYTKNGYITKRKTNKYLGYVLVIPYFMLDDDSSLTITSLMFHKPEDVIGLNIVGSYFDLGDRAIENKISIWKNWGNFKKFYYWMIIRNGFYNFNYIVEDSSLNKCGELAQGVSPRIHKGGPNPVEFSEHGFYQDSNGKWFFLMTLCKHFLGKAYGYEFGWRRIEDGGVNAITRIYFAKQITVDEVIVNKRTPEELEILYAKFDRDVKKRSRLFRTLLVLDQLLNVVFWNGSQDETVSSHIGRRIKAGKATWFDKKLCCFLKKFEHEHCEVSIGE